MNLVRCIGEGILFALILGIFSKKRPDVRKYIFALSMIIEVFSVYFLYRGQENALFFFLQPYIALFIMNISDFAVYKRAKMEKLIIWPLFVLPAMAGFVLSVSWMMKIRFIADLLGQ